LVVLVEGVVFKSDAIEDAAELSCPKTKAALSASDRKRVWRILGRRNGLTMQNRRKSLTRIMSQRVLPNPMPTKPSR